MKHWSAHRLAFFIYALAAASGALLAAVRVLVWGTASSNPASIDLSLGRVVLATVLLLFACGFLAIGLLIFRRASFSDHLYSHGLEGHAAARRTQWISITLLVLAGLLASIPGYRLPESLAAYLQRLQPVLAWLSALGAGGIVLMLVFPYDQKLREARLAAPTSLKLAGVLLGLFLLAWLLIWLTGLGLGRREDYWYGAGVPALPLQVLLSLLLGLLVMRFGTFARRVPLLDFILFGLIWGAGAWLWSSEPMRTSFFMPGPFRPTHDFYPFSDGMLFDVGGQFALIGQGILNGAVFDRVLYMVWSVYLHALAGQDFVKAMAVQAALFAVFPAILYLLGKEIHSRPLGVSLAVMAMLRGVNSIAAATWMDLANPKMTLTDFPTAIGVALFALLVVRWLKNSGRNWQAAMWAGAVLGLTAMLRTHVLLLLPAALVISVSVYRTRWRAWLLGALLVIVGMFVVTLPWDLRNQARGAPPFSLYFSRIQLILKERYDWPAGDASLLPTENDSLAMRGGAVRLASVTRLSGRMQPLSKPCSSQACRLANHLLHNLTASVLFLPTSLALDDLRYTVKQAFPYWDQDWRGAGLTSGALLLLVLNLALIALGISISYRSARWVGLVPAAVYAGYVLSDSLAFTSGGRYIVPVDWVISLYYLLGALQLVYWAACRLGWAEKDLQANAAAARAAAPGASPHQVAWGLVVLLGILLVGCLLPLSEKLYPQRYAANPKPVQGASWLREQGLLDQKTYGLARLGLPTKDLRQFLDQPGSGVWQGRMLYPRYYLPGLGEIGGSMPYDTRSFPRMAFTLIGPSGQSGVMLPGDLRGRFGNALDVVVLGCSVSPAVDAKTSRIEALAVFLVQDPNVAYLRSPMPPLECPLREPVCITKDKCK